MDSATVHEEIDSLFESTPPLKDSAKIIDKLNQIIQFNSPSAALLNGVANIGMVELGEVQVPAYLSERKLMGRFFFKNVVAFPSGCKPSDCLIQFEGELSVDAVTDWFAMAVLNELNTALP
ncbi:hypothetical protein PVK06_004762 [Gossypium arboreum]|uniref:Uncharacterized protein n=1 Tax=Gossypium arboreum TaxID=29729 RepID=A0ABR0QSV2_GOSAR|nr:hypothetical protein PVK06_004762 [Gossypium arboreum]